MILLLINIFSYAKLGKILLSASSIILSIGTYAMLYGWRYAAGFVALIFCHEMGHYLAAKQKKLNVGLPTFIPFLGAWIQLKEQPMNAEVEAYVAYAGPFVGTVASFAVYFLGMSNGNHLLIALAQAGFIINLFNLIPLHPLDGGRITSVISPRVWFVGVPLLVAVWFYFPSPILIIIAVLSAPQLIKAWKYDPHLPENKAYYAVKLSTRIEYSVLYLGLAIILALMIEKLTTHLVQ
ncbi:MAG: site-2 protease family protein [Alphaproteobacteria bacterium]|nr:site-2 protease family protein [Alphaproteobacteria bacterium]